MALIVEDGTGKSDANAYDSLANVSAAIAAVGGAENTAWQAAANDAAREAAIVRATRWVDSTRRGRWSGTKATREQALDWPRYGASDCDDHAIESDEVPQEVRLAVAAVAPSCLNSDPLAPLSEEEQKSLTSESITVGPISISETYSGASWTERISSPAADSLLDRVSSNGAELFRG